MAGQAPKIVLGVAAHADDLDFGMAGSAARWISEGAEVYYLILTNGDKGNCGEDIGSDELRVIRRREQLAAAKILGVKDVFFCDYPDGLLQCTPELKCDIIRCIRKVKPEIVVTIDPSLVYYAPRGFINHPDHRAAGQATLDAVYPLARDLLSFPDLASKEGLQPHIVETVLLLSFENQNYHVDITDYMGKKLETMAAFASQKWNLPEKQAIVRELAARTGESAGVDYAESFIRIDVQD